MKQLAVFWGTVLVLASPLMPAADVVHELLRERASRGGGFPSSSRAAVPAVLWSFDAPDFGGDVTTVCHVGDVDEDGLPDVVASIYDAGMSGDNLYCFSGGSSVTPAIIWSLRTSTGVSGGGGYGDKCLAASADLDGDGYQEVLHGTAWGGRSALCFSGIDGAQLWVYDTYNDPQSGWMYAVAPLPDVTGDGLPEALAAAGAYNSTVYCIDGASSGTATVVWRFAASDGFTSVVPIADVNGDGYADALAGCGTNFANNRAYCLSGASAGTATVLWSLQSTSVVHAVAAMDDVDGDGVQEALAGSWSDTVYCVSGASAATPVILWTADVGDRVMRLVPTDDLDGDGCQEVLVGSWDNAIICLRGSNGTVLWSTPTGTLNGGDVWSLDATGDLDGDGLADAVAGSFDQNVYLCSGSDGHVLGQFPTGKRLYTVRAMPDVTGDGRDEILAGTQGLSGTRGTLYCLSAANVILSGSLSGGQLVLQWTACPGTSAYWIYGADNRAYFQPGLTFPYQHRQAVLLPLVTTWATPNGVGDPDHNRTYLVIAVDASEQEISRSNRFGEQDFGTTG